MLQCLSVFQGGFALADVAAIADVAGHVAVDLVDALAAKSLIDVTRDDRGQIRHRLLETIRLFALSRLVEANEIVTVRDRHLDHFLHDRAGASMNDWLDIASMERTDREFENFRSAAVWALEQGRTEATVRLAAMLAEALPAHGEPHTALEWLQLPVNLHGRELVFALTVRAYVRQVTRDFEGAQHDADEAITAARAHPCDDVLFAMMTQAVGEGIRGNFELQTQMLHEGRDVAAPFGANVRAMTDFYWMRSFLRRAPDRGGHLGRGRHLRKRTDLRLSLLGRAHACPRAGDARPDRRRRSARRTFSAAPPTRIGLRPTSSTTRSWSTPADRSTRPDRWPPSLEKRSRGGRRRWSTSSKASATSNTSSAVTTFAREIALHTSAVVGMGLSEWLVNELHGATTVTVHQIWRDVAAEHPVARRFAFALDRAPLLFAEEIARWS